MITKEEYLKAVDIVKNYRNQILEELREVKEINESILSEIPKVKIIYSEDTKLSHVSMSTKLMNRIRYGLRTHLSELTFNDLKDLNEYEVLRWRNTGKKTLEELKNIMNQAGLNLKK